MSAISHGGDSYPAGNGAGTPVEPEPASARRSRLIVMPPRMWGTLPSAGTPSRLVGYSADALSHGSDGPNGAAICRSPQGPQPPSALRARCNLANTQSEAKRAFPARSQKAEQTALNISDTRHHAQRPGGDPAGCWFSHSTIRDSVGPIAHCVLRGLRHRAPSPHRPKDWGGPSQLQRITRRSDFASRTRG